MHFWVIFLTTAFCMNSISLFSQPADRPVNAPLSYDYESVPGDPLGVKMYTLENGMKLYLSVNKKEPRIYTNIAVRAGSKHDPADATGLAHYLEHMMFKGTDKIGALNWEQEKVLLGGISRLYEEHKNTEDPAERAEVYDKIDRMSNKAANLVAANEYDKMVAALGAKGTNAYTWVEQTVYVNDIPSNELKRWMELESERFSQLVLRLFHTELEAVYEEFNINQDRDFRKVFKAVSETLFPTHPYGTQTTIGTGEHLKNPSHVKIHQYFDTYYQPNNMALVLAGDFDPDQAVAWAEEYFGSYQKGRIPEFKVEPQPDLTETVTKEVFGQESENVTIAWRFDGASSADHMLLQLISGMLYNRQAGVLDINLNQAQKVLSSNAWNWLYEDYSAFGLGGQPREGQSLEEVKKLLMEQIEHLKNGEFEDWLIDAVVRDIKLSETRASESNNARVSAMTDAFVLGLPWERYVKRFEEMRSYRKEDIMNFAKEHLNDNCVVVYKRSSEDPNVAKVEKPAITPVSLNREDKSAFATSFLSQESESLTPSFVDYDAVIQRSTLKDDIQFDYIRNEANEIFELYYILEMGKKHDKMLPLAVDYLKFLGTDKYSPQELQQEFYKLGLSFDVSSSDDRVYVSLTGLPESFRRGVVLFEHILANAEGNEEALENMVNDRLQRRQNAKKNKRAILNQALSNYARFGKQSSYLDRLSEEELKALKPKDLTDIIHNLTNYEHRVFYYGQAPMGEVQEFLEKEHRIPKKLLPIPKPAEYSHLDMDSTRVLFVDFPMVQAEVLLISKGEDQFNLDHYLMSEWYNSYFGYGLSSIVFQEIRESRALAYSAYTYFSSPADKNKPHYLQAYVGTQADKLSQAIPALRQIIDEMPVSADQIETARASILKKLQTERMTGSSVYWNYWANARKGYDRDLNKDLYTAMQNSDLNGLLEFQKSQVRNRNYTILVLGSKENVSMDYLSSLGPVTELTLEEIFGY